MFSTSPFDLHGSTFKGHLSGWGEAQCWSISGAFLQVCASPGEKDVRTTFILLIFADVSGGVFQLRVIKQQIFVKSPIVQGTIIKAL